MNAELRKQEEEHVVVYVRVARARSGDDIRAERQRGHCLALCGRLGYEPDEIDVYQDVNAAARSGRTLPGFDELLARVQPQGATQILAWHIDRLCRTPGALASLVALAKTRPVRVETVAGARFELGTSKGRPEAGRLVAIASTGARPIVGMTGSQRTPGGDRHGL
ncbi:recombinase family protein [Georgenia sp. TF02-10]|uniref:recombinase family protein n=1 Tax=Georgenia sp. TF02-10 TaxID=2917725 RepID=UPI001FA7A633|nr:recombinase family protein [Georgenia sp. TF02-10]UNX53545.1 recombinase family protein [Georgenia sp. TF02-10]